MFLLSDHNLVSNEGDLIIFLSSKDIAEWNEITVKKKNEKK